MKKKGKTEEGREREEKEERKEGRVRQEKEKWRKLKGIIIILSNVKYLFLSLNFPPSPLSFLVSPSPPPFPS